MEWPERIARAVVASQRARTALIEGGEVLEVDGLVLCLSNLPDPSLNGTMVEREPSDAEAALAGAEELARERGWRLGVFKQEGRHASLDAAIVERGMTKLFGDPAMAAGVAELIDPPVPEGVRLALADARSFDDLARIDAAAFGSDPDVSARSFRARMLELPGLCVAQAFLDGQPVGQAIAHLIDGAIGVFGVAVAEPARRRGIGAAVTAFAVRSFGDGDFAWLMAKEGARSMYARLGFRPVADWAVWTEA